MAYNVLSGTVISPNIFKPGNSSTNIISGSLQGDGTNIANVPRVSNAGDNRILTVVGSDANSLNAESDFTFDTLSGIVSSPKLKLTSLVAGTATTASYLALDASNNVVLTSSSGGGASGGTIGAAEDGDYTDGLFTDFTTSTAIGTAIDRFNEILKALAPSPAPTLDDVGSSDTGVSGKLSFGSSQGISNYSNVGTTAGFSAVDINSVYQVQTSGNNLRRGIFNRSVTINGILNDDVSADGSNYPNDSFGNANQGLLVLEVNGTEVHQVSLTSSAVGSGVPGSGTDSDLNASGSGFVSLSQTGSAQFSDGTELDIFQHRTGQYSISPNDQRDGWNYARVIHRIGVSDTTTNYVEWVNDSDANALSATSGSLNSLSMTGDIRVSGVKYHTGGTATYNVTVDNAYRNIYSTSNISFSTSNVSVSSQVFPSIDWGSGEDETKQLRITGSATINSTKILNSSISVGVTVPHPLKSNLSNAQNNSISGILVYNLSNNSTTTSETFRRENYRIVSGTYGTQANVTSSGNAWDSTQLLSSNGGLLFYNERLYYPTDSDIPNSGDFSSITNGPASNADYSALTGDRHFYRYFTNTGASSQTNFRLTFSGDSSTRIVPSTTSLSSTNIHVFVKLPTTTNSKQTGWLDLAVASASDESQLNDGDGAYVGTPSNLTINTTHEGTFVTQTVEQNENLVIRVVAGDTWTGYISSISIAWGSA